MKTIIGITGASGMLGKHLLYILSKKRYLLLLHQKSLVNLKIKI